MLRAQPVRTTLVRLVLVAALPLLALAAGLIVVVHARERAAVQRGAADTARALMTAIDGELRSVIAVLETLAESESLRRHDLAAFHADARAALRHRPEWVAIAIAKPDGEHILNTLRPFGTTLPAVPERSLKDAEASVRPVVGGLRKGPLTGAWQVPVLLPIARAPSTSYILTAVVKPDAFAAILRQQGLHRDWTAAVLDRDTRIVARSRAPDLVGGPASPDLVRESRAREQGVFDGITREGITTYTAFRRSAVTGWTVAIGVPRSTVQRSLVGTLGAVAGGGGILLAIGVGIAFLVGRGLSRTLGRFTQTASAVGRGEPVPTGPPSPIREVAAAEEALAQAARLLHERAEERRRSEERYRLLLESSVQGVFIHVRGVICYANSAMARIFGYERADEIVGRDAWDIVAPHEKERLRGYAATRLAGRSAPSAYELQAVRRTGEIFWIEARVSITSWDGETAILTTLSEITERKEAERAGAERFAREQARHRETQAIAAIGRSIAQGVGLPMVAQGVADHALALLGAIAASVYRIDEDAGDLVSLAVAGDMGPDWRAGDRLPAGQGITGRAAIERRALASADALADPDVVLDPGLRARLSKASYRSVLAVPLLLREEIVGVFAIGDRAGRVFTEEEMRLAEAFADQAAVALSNARLYSEAQLRRREAEMLADIGQVLNTDLDVDAVLRRVTEAARALTDSDLSRIALWDDAAGAVVSRQHVGMRHDGWSGLVLPAGHGLGGEVIATGRPARSDDVLVDPRLYPGFRAAVEAEGVRSICAVPIHGRNRVEGVLYAERRTVRPFTAHDERALTRLAEQAAIALRNAELYQRGTAARIVAERAAGRARLLAGASETLASSLDYDATLRAVAGQLVPELAEWVTVHLVRRDGSIRRVGPVATAELRQIAGEVERLVPSLDWFSDASPTVRVIGGSDPVLLNDLPDGWLDEHVREPRYRELLRQLDPRYVIVVPLVARTRPLGVLTLVRRRPGPAYDADDVALAADLGRRAALAIDAARLVRRTEQARAEAEAANQAKDEFLAMLGHELRNPLGAITSATSVLAVAEASAESAARARAIIARQAQHLGRLVDDLLDVARVMQGKITLHREPTDLAEIAERAVQTIEAASGRGRSIAVDATHAWVSADVTRLEQVVGNLLNNAWKFTAPHGRIAVEVGVDGRDAILRVRDDGAGIAPDVLPRVFDLFVQGHGAIDRARGGLGIGLTLVRRLVELHGGSVRVESEGVGRGTTVTVRLPRVRAPREAAPEPVPDAFAGRRVVLVEDNDDAREMLRAVLELSGHEVLEAGDGAAGVELTLAEKPDAAVIDIGLPGFDGYEVARRIRAAEVSRRTFLVALTGYGQAQDRERATAAGFDAHMVKPADPAHLSRLITTLGA